MNESEMPSLFLMTFAGIFYLIVMEQRRFK